MYSICTRSICPSKSNGARSKYASETDEPRSQPTSNDSVAVNVSGTVNGVVASSACLPSMLKISLAGAPGLADADALNRNAPQNQWIDRCAQHEIGRAHV